MAKVKAKETPAQEPMTCVAFTFQASKESGQFSNYRIVSIFIENGKIVHVEKSQEFATFEALARAEVFISASLWNLSSRYQPGLYTALGGDQVRELTARLEKQDRGSLERISSIISPKKPRDAVQ